MSKDAVFTAGKQILAPFINSIETLAETRNIEDLSAARISPVISDQVQYPISMEALTSSIRESLVSIKPFKFRYNQSTF